MDAQELRDLLTPEQIIVIMASLGEDTYKIDSEGNYIFRTICHNASVEGASYKLYYYTKSKLFHCYTSCSESFNIFDLVQRNIHCTFSESIGYICKVLGIQQQKRRGFISTKHIIEDWELINKYKKNKDVEKYTNEEIRTFDENILNFFKDIYHQSWIDDNISIQAMQKYKIKFDISRNKIIIPHYNEKGQLIGIRGRALNEDEVEAGKKYMPIYIEGTEYSHQLGNNVYGLYQNKQTIQKTKKILIYEAEKSVLQTESYFPDNNFSVAVCGSNITNYVRSMILSLGVREVFIAFDKQYKNPESEEAYKYADKLKYLASKFSSYCTTYVLWDNDNLLDYKDSPSDKGKEILLELMKKKFEIVTKCEE